MEKEFVPYNLSLRMKQLGYDEPCLMYWYKASNGYVLVNKKDQTFQPYTNAPLYQQAFRWFREKYGYLHHITYFNPSKAQIPGEADYQGLVLFPHQDIHKLPKSNYDTYEKVELACLEKLIEIAESNGKEEML
jgi:hypothetical protein